MKTLRTLFAASVVTVLLPLNRAFLVGLPSSALSINLKRITGRGQVPEQSTLLKYSTGDQPNKIFNYDDLQSKQDVYRTVAELDPQWYEKFVTNILGKEKLKEIGLPVSAPLKAKSTLNGKGEGKALPDAIGAKISDVTGEPLKANTTSVEIKNVGGSLKDSPLEGKEEDSTIQVLGQTETLSDDQNQAASSAVEAAPVPTKKAESLDTPKITAESQLSDQAKDTSDIEAATKLHTTEFKEVAGAVPKNNQEKDTSDSETVTTFNATKLKEVTGAVPENNQEKGTSDSEAAAILNTTELKEVAGVASEVGDKSGEGTADSRSAEEDEVKDMIPAAESMDMNKGRPQSQNEKSRSENAPKETTDKTLLTGDGASKPKILDEMKVAGEDESRDKDLSATTSLKPLKTNQRPDDETLTPVDISEDSAPNKDVSEETQWARTKEEPTSMELPKASLSNQTPRQPDNAEDASLNRKSEGETEMKVESNKKDLSKMEREQELKSSRPKDQLQKEEAFSHAVASANARTNEGYVDSKVAVNKETMSKVDPKIPVEEMVVVYTLDGESLAEPLSTLTNLGYTKEDVFTLQSDAVDLIIADSMVKPKSGVPRSWQILPSSKKSRSDEADSVKIMRLADFEEGQGKKISDGLERARATKGTSGVEKKIPTDQPTKPPSPPKIMQPKDIKEVAWPQNAISMQPVSAPSRDSREVIMADAGEKLEPPKMEDTAEASNDSVNVDIERDKSESKQDEVAIYRDPVLGKMRVTPLKNLALLGYSKIEILNMRPDVLGAIATERRPRPKTGVPLQWCISEEDRDKSEDFEAVKVVPRSDIDVYKKAHHPTREVESDTSGQGPPTEQRKERRRDRSDRGPLGADGQRKRIYNVRKQSGTIPGSFGRETKPWVSWPDKDKFRDMLRTEAELRVRLTSAFGGDDFIDAIKDECDMRLGLYEGWLKTLETGVGEPILPIAPPRSERRYVVPPKKEDQEDRKKKSPRTRKQKKRDE